MLKTELRLGVVSSVTAHLLRVNLGYAGNPSAAYFSGGRYGKGEVGEFVLIENQQGLLLGRVVEVRLPESDRRAISQDYSGTDHLDAIAMVQLLGSVPMDQIAISAGVDSYPRLGDRVYAAPHQFIALIPALMDLKGDKPNPVRLTLGTVGGASEGVISVTPETLFGRHCAILGATGGGKSWTTARIIEECIKHQAKIILLDATGEYRGFSGDHVMHCHLGKPIKKSDKSMACSLPPTSFQESDFIALFDPAGKVQGPKLKAAIRSLRVAALKPGIALNGIIKKIDNTKSHYISALQDTSIAAKIDDPRQPFDINKLCEQIEQECVHPDGFGIGKGVKDTSKWGGESGEFSHCLSLVSRINSVKTSVAFNCTFKDSSNPLTKKIDTFRTNHKRLLRICLSGIQHEFNAREIISNVLGRYLLTEARAGKFKQRPVIVIVDEAHNFLGKHIGSEDSSARLDAFELIAKEGRKYGLNICLATQRPRDITEGVLSQMGTLIVHRLTNDRDREVVERACGEIDRSASAFLPNLKPGEAAIIGVDFPIPLTVQINKPTVRPQSDGPDFQNYWSVKPAKDAIDQE
ncbi:MAG: ATP-binding protein [Methylococcales bacterium]|nr:ATP-binding protein [Methylococcales bacterium]